VLREVEAMLRVFAYVGIDIVMVTAILVALSCLVYLIVLTVREHFAGRAGRHYPANRG
jgi:hypothetical protein